MATLSEPRKFGTYTGVFTPTLLTIVGVIMYVRLPWVMGNAGLVWGWLIMAVAIGITLCTGLSLSSIATNTRIGDGGAYAIVQRSLGFEIGGSIGVPLYLTRPLGTAMYIFGFREGWLWVFPDHPPLLVDSAVFAVIFALAYIGADVAFKVQHIIMAVIVGSIVSILASPSLRSSTHTVPLIGDFPGFAESGFKGTDVWVVFALFFPATTGILAGTNMSGELENPRKSIPAGTLWAIAVSTVIYLVLGFAALKMGTTDELTNNYNFFIDRAFYRPIVLAGLLGATFSSALAGCLGGPRILMAMGEHDLVPGSGWLKRKARNGEPRNAIVVTAALTYLALLLRDLNAIAPMLTMFFLITYGTINVVLLIETSLGLVSFRPSMRVPIWVPFLGALGSIFAMFIINATFGLIAVGAVIAIYVWLQRHIGRRGGDDVRSSMFVSLAEWASSRVNVLDTAGVRAWKPRILVPVTNPDEIRGEFQFLVELARPEGSLNLIGLCGGPEEEAELRPDIERLGTSLQAHDISAVWSVVHEPNLRSGTLNSLLALQSAFFRPNMVCVRHPPADRRDEVYGLVRDVHRAGVGALVLAVHPEVRFGQKDVVNVWLIEQSPDWSVESTLRHQANINLLLLMGYRIARSWGAQLNLVCAVRDPSQGEAARRYLLELSDLARLPERTSSVVLTCSFADAMVTAPPADLQILGVGVNASADVVDVMLERAGSSVLVVADSGQESALA